MISVREVEEKLGLPYDQIRKRKNIGLIRTNEGLMITEEGFKRLEEELLFISKCLTVKEAEELSGLSRKKLLNRLKEDEEWRLVRNAVYINKEALERLIKERETYKEFLEESVTLKQAHRISGFHIDTIRKHLKEGEEWINFDGGYYVKKQALERLMEERGVAPTIQVTLNSIESTEDYTLFKEVCEANNLDYEVLRNRTDLKEYTIKANNRVYLKNDIIPKLIEEKNFIKNSYTRRDLEKLFDVSSQRLAKGIDEIKKDVDWRLIAKFEYFNKDMVDKKIADYGGGTQYYKVCRARKHESSFDEDNSSETNITYVSTDILEINNDTYIKVNAIEEHYSLTLPGGGTLTTEILKSAINRGTITDVYRDKLNVHYVSKKELDSIKDTLDYSVSIVELGEEYRKLGKSYTQKSRFLNLCPPGSQCFNFNVFGKSHDRIRTTNPEQFKADFVKRVKEEIEYRNTTNPHDRYEWLEKKEVTKEQKKEFPFLIKTYKEFVFIKINNSNSNNLLNLTHELFNALSRFTNAATKDIHLLSDDEILQIFSTDEMTGSDRVQFSNYLNYLRRKYPDECLFKNQYNRYRENKVRNVDDVYTLEEWLHYSNFLTDINRHIEKSFERYAYAKRWLYAILHFSVAWRSGDFLETPGLDFLDNSGNSELDNLDIDRYTLDWFKNNDFKLSDGQIIINSVKRFVEDRETRKTGARKHFVIPRHYVIPVSIAFIIAEQHRRASNSSTLFSIKTIESGTLREYLGEEMAGFSSRKANRSLLSYIYDEANESEQYNSIAYSMASYMRSHKPNMYQKAETTSQYIYALNKDGDINTISRQLFRRGVFGWLYKVMLDLAYGNGSTYGEQYSSLSQMTTDIETLQKELSVYGIENMSRFMTYEKDIRRNVFYELFKAPKDQLKELIHQLILGNLSSKERDIYCITPKKCPFPTQNSCKGCRYSIPTNYSLLAISDELLALCEKLSLADINDTVSRQKYSFQITRLMMVLREAKTEFDRFDPDYFKTFVPLKKLGNRIEEVKPKML